MRAQIVAASDERYRYPSNLDCEYVMKNKFAFGGVNTSLIYRRWHD